MKARVVKNILKYPNTVLHNGYKENRYVHTVARSRINVKIYVVYAP